MALYDIVAITELTDYFGAIELEMDSAITNILGEIVPARQLVYNYGMLLNAAEFDRISQLAASIRLNENTMPSALQASLSLSVGAIDNYFRQTFDIGMREYYDGSDAGHTVSWNDMFRQLWRREMNQELVIRLATAVNTGGVWITSVISPGIELASDLEVRADTTLGATNVSLTIGLTTEADEDVNTGMSITANTAEGTATPITYGVLSRFIDLRTLAASGGTNGDELSIWVTV